MLPQFYDAYFLTSQQLADNSHFNVDDHRNPAKDRQNRDFQQDRSQLTLEEKAYARTHFRKKLQSFTGCISIASTLTHPIDEHSTENSAMILLAASWISLLVLVSTAGAQQATDAQQVRITRAGARPSRPAADEHFTGAARVDSSFQGTSPARIAGARVMFEPGARTAWHTHPLGQTLIVTAGVGRVQRWGEPVDEIRQGDVVWIPPGQKHWHGAAPNSSMTHIAITEQLDGKTVDWMAKVTDEQFRAPLRGQSAAPVAPALGTPNRKIGETSLLAPGAIASTPHNVERFHQVRSCVVTFPASSVRVHRVE